MSDQSRTVCHMAVEFAAILRKKYGGTPSIDQLISELSSTEFKRCPANVVFTNGLPIGRRELARAIPNASRDWSDYTIHVREFLRNEPALAHVLAHELCRVRFGQFINEFDADSFGAMVMGLSYDKFRAVIHEFEDKLENNS